MVRVAVLRYAVLWVCYPGRRGHTLRRLPPVRLVRGRQRRDRLVGRPDGDPLRARQQHDRLGRAGGTFLRALQPLAPLRPRAAMEGEWHVVHAHLHRRLQRAGERVAVRQGLQHRYVVQPEAARPPKELDARGHHVQHAGVDRQEREHHARDHDARLPRRDPRRPVPWEDAAAPDQHGRQRGLLHQHAADDDRATVEWRQVQGQHVRHDRRAVDDGLGLVLPRHLAAGLGPKGRSGRQRRAPRRCEAVLLHGTDPGLG
mmetsp:Transcript_7568/g.14803  ORF Transcript_7568/g.14803 Transcript_7568/m.14803 type:complete len:258 (-) Transcript_7568:935-1708(-)